MRPYPIQLDVSSPPRFDRIQLLVRIAVSMFLGWLGITMGWLTTVLFFALPVLAVVIVSTRGPDAYLANTAPKVWPALRWLFAFGAYMLLITDRIPVDEDRQLTCELETTGRPTLGSALLRLLCSIPSAIALCFVGFVSCLMWLAAAFTILVDRTVPPSIAHFQTGYLRWYARLLAYHASFVAEYPPFSFGERAGAVPEARVVAP